MRKKNLIIAVGLMVFLLIVLFGYMVINPVRLKSTNIICEYKKEFHPKQYIQSVFLANREDVLFHGNIDVNQLGKYHGQYRYKNQKIDVTVEVKDLTPPVLKVKEYTTDVVEEITPELFVESIKDDTEVKFSFEKEVSKEEGESEVLVLATDQSGNTTKEKAKLKRVKDQQAPTVKAHEILSFVLGSEYDLKKGLIINDDIDPAPIVEIDSSKVDFTKPGKYSISYLVKDRSGNETKMSRDVLILSNDEIHSKVVYLTFDDGPSNNTEKILKILDKYNVKATFFVTGNHPEFNGNIKKAYDAGHAIGLHTYTHEYSKVYRSMDAYFKDLDAVNDMVEKITGQRSNIIRFPGGSSNTISANYSPKIMSKLVKEVRKRGYQYFDWNCDSTDASGNNVPAKQIVKNAKSGVGQYINILFHDTDAKDTTVEALPKIIKYYKSKGYIFLGLHSESYAPHHDVNN